MAPLISTPSAGVGVTSVGCACPVERAAAVEGGEPFAQTVACTLKAGTVCMYVSECERESMSVCVSERESERAPLESNLKR